jgi:hypothetical protein
MAGQLGTVPAFWQRTTRNGTVTAGITHVTVKTGTNDVHGRLWTQKACRALLRSCALLGPKATSISPRTDVHET